MRDPDAFDRCYAESRSRLLHQTFALTGDLQASRSAVRDAFVAAWHHWGKVGRLADPEDWIRPRAWHLAQRRHTRRIWHRDRGLDPEAKATLEALGKLSVSERRVLLLTQLSAVPLPEIAREIGLPLAMAERKLQTATAHFTTYRDVPASGIRPLLDHLHAHVDAHRWPRATIVRRAGATRRRTHTAVGVVAMVALLVASGAVVTDAGGVRPGLHREATTAAAEAPHSSATTAEPSVSPTLLTEEFSADQLLTGRQLAGLVPGRTWHAVDTSDNSRGPGLPLPCQTQRYADPKVVAALTRSFRSAQPHKPPLAGAELVELSDNARAARRTYATTVGWFAGCTDDRVQLMETRRVTGVGDAATAFVLRDWDNHGATIVAQVSRTGVATTSVATTMPSGVPMPRALDVLSDAVNGVCNLPGGGRCAGGADSEAVPPLPAGVAPGMLGEFDLPPVATVRLPWVGTDPHRAMHNLAATGCDATSFHQRGMTRNMTRSFVVPGSRMPSVFGLTQSVARLPERGAAAAVVAGIRKDLTTCPDRKLGTKVSRIAETASGPEEMAVWHITTEISDQQSVTYLMGIARHGDAITQVGFVPSGNATMTSAAFVALMKRSQERLDTLP